MKKTLVIAAAAASCGLFAAGPAAAFDFEGSTGLPASALRGKGKVEYVSGVSGKAIKLSDSTLSIPCPAKITPQEGSFSLWIKPVNWDSGKEEFVTFMFNLNKSKKGRLMIYKYRKNTGLGLVSWFGDPDSRNRIILADPKADFKQGKWMQITFTWSKKDLVCKTFINGRKTASAKCKPELFYNDFGDFVLNAIPFNPRNRSFETVYDLVRFYPEALSDAEAAESYKNDLKNITK